MSDIHLEDYTDNYEKIQLNAENMLFMGGRETVSLNGEWNYAVDQYDTCLRAKWYQEHYVDDKGFTLPVDYSWDEWPTMTLPCCWNVVEPEYKLYESSMIFVKKFKADVKPGERLFLRIGAASMLCRVFLNKQYLGMHRGASTPFFCDLTGEIKAEEENRLILVVDATRRHEQIPPENTDWFNYGGIFRDIELVKVPAVYIKDFRIGLVPDGTFKNIFAEVEAGFAPDCGLAAQLRIPELGIEKEIKLESGSGRIEFEAPVELWSPENPKLYDVSLTLASDRVSDAVGFRQISVRGREILLNGKSLFLKGISAHEDSADHGRALTDDERTKVIKTAKELGCNMIRVAHYPHHENMSKLADKLGIMLWEEIPVYWAVCFDRKETYEDAENQLTELIKRDFNRSSVIIWSVGNENADTEERFKFMGGLADHAHEIDKTRMVSAACLVDATENIIADRLAAKLDIIGTNEYCGWYTPDFAKLPQLFENSNPDKPVIITEFGADARKDNHGDINTKGTLEYQAEIYRKQTETIGSIPYVRGMSPWILFDFRCPRRTSNIQNYYNRKGLLDERMEVKKPAFYVLQEFYKNK